MDPNQLDIAVDNNVNDGTTLIWLKAEFIFLVVSNTIYLVFVIKSIIRLYKTRDWHFIFLLIAASFALANNTSDIYYRILASLKDVFSCHNFRTVFKISASLNWVPISYYQVTRLYRICVNYYRKSFTIGIIVVSMMFSLLYSFFYFKNLFLYEAVRNKFGGCVVTNSGKYSLDVEIFDIFDTSFSVIIIIVTLFVSLKNLKRYKLRHLRIKSMLDENVVLFFALVISKIVLYYIITINAKKPGGDIWWDSLSIIVLYCAYRLMNLKPKLNQKLEEPLNQRNRNLFKDLAINNRNDRQNTRKNNKSKFYNRNSKGELNFPSLMKKDNNYDISQNHFIFNNNDSKYNNFNNINVNYMNNFNENRNLYNPPNLQSPTSSHTHISINSNHYSNNRSSVNSQKKKKKLANINMNYGFEEFEDEYESNLSNHSHHSMFNNNKNYGNNSSYAVSSNHSFNSNMYHNQYRF